MKGLSSDPLCPVCGRVVDQTDAAAVGLVQRTHFECALARGSEATKQRIAADIEQAKRDEQHRRLALGIAARRVERAEIVAWIRTVAGDGDEGARLREVARSIEAGEHALAAASAEIEESNKGGRS